jgi:predicted RNA binding protein YcfA (HicA-like mRNA interferase family)
MKYAPTSHNRPVYASPLKGLGLHSARSPKGSHASFRHIGGGGLATQALICPPKHRLQPGTLHAGGLKILLLSGCFSGI